MKQISKMVLGVLLAVLLMTLSGTAMATTYDGNESDLYCYKKTTNVTVDGNISAGEWSDADYISWYYTPLSDHYDAYIYCYAKWDDDYIYFMVDLCPDNSTEALDFCMVWLDENGDGYFGYEAGAYEHYFEVTGSQLEYTGAFNGSDYNVDDDPEAYLGYAESSKVSWEHRIIEFKINLTAINYTDTMGVLFTGYGTLAPNYFSTEGANGSNFQHNETCANWTILHMENTQYLVGQIQSTLIPLVMDMTILIVTMSVIVLVVKMLGKSFKGIK